MAVVKYCHFYKMAGGGGVNETYGAETKMSESGDGDVRLTRLRRFKKTSQDVQN